MAQMLGAAFGLTIRIRRFPHRRAVAAFERKGGSEAAPNAGRCTFTFTHVRSTKRIRFLVKSPNGIPCDFVVQAWERGGSSGQSRN